MAQKRMFNKSITNSSRFLMMPPTSQILYIHLGMNADDDGFVEHFPVMRMVEAKPDDLKILSAKGFVKVFDDQVLVITEWKENNSIRSDRYTPSKYLDVYKQELLQLSQKEVGIPDGNQPSTKPQPKVDADKDIDTGIDKDIVIDTDKEREAVLTQKKQDFIIELKKCFDGESFGKEVIEELRAFAGYWTEPDKNWKKQKEPKIRYDHEQTWDMKRRVATWMKNCKQWNKKETNNKYKVEVDEENL